MSSVEIRGIARSPARAVNGMPGQLLASALASILLSVGASYLLRLAMSSGPISESGSAGRMRPVSNANPTAVFVFIPILVGNSGNKFGERSAPGFLRSRGRRRRR